MSAQGAQDLSDHEVGRAVALSVDSVSVRFGGITALDGISFEATAGEVLGIIGPNGAGKTTLFDVSSGVREPNDGKIILDGVDVTTSSTKNRARRGLRRTFVLLLDEPASGLDETEIERLGSQIQLVRAETGCVILLVEHDVGFVMQQSDRIVVLDLGTVLATGTPEVIQKNPAVRDAYLGVSTAVPDAAVPLSSNIEATSTDGAV